MYRGSAVPCLVMKCVCSAYGVRGLEAICGSAWRNALQMKAVQSGFWTGLSPGTEVPRPWDSDKEPCSMQDCDAEGKACCGSTPPCSSSNATCLGRSYAAQAKATNTSTLVIHGSCQEAECPPFLQIGCLPRACKCSRPLAHCASIRLVILEAHLLLQTFKHRCLACNERICAV